MFVWILEKLLVFNQLLKNHKNYQMDQIRYFQRMRPRYSNPTYNSNSVGTTLGLFYASGGGSNYNNAHNNFQQNSSRALNDSYKSKLLQRSYQPQVRSSYKYQQFPRDFGNGQKQSQQKFQSNQSIMKNNSSISNNPQEVKSNASYHKDSGSRFSRFGSSSLVLPQMNDKQIYQKQAKNYNIISIKPKQYYDTIKQYPKFRLQNEDGNFYKKMHLQNQYRRLYQQKRRDQLRGKQDYLYKA